MNRWLRLTGLLTLWSLWPTVALGFCRTVTCERNDAPPEECTGQRDLNDCLVEGLPLYWPQPCISFSVGQSGSPRQGITAAQLERVVRDSFDSWQSVSCWGQPPGLSVETYPQVACEGLAYRQDGPNQNLWMFRDSDWPYKNTGDRALAMTVVTFNYKTGEIYDVDVELNSFARHFTLEAASAVDDLPSVVQHESGHFLGLSHTNVRSATMYAYYAPHDLTMRTLEPDDAMGICTVFPPGEIPEDCDAEPRHGFSTECETDDGMCSMAVSPSRQTVAPRLLLCLLGLGLATARRRRPAPRVQG